MSRSSRRRGAVALVLVGTAVLLVFGLSMLAARDTQTRAERSLRPWDALLEIELRADPPFVCSPISAREGGLFLASLGDFDREAACLKGHGLLTSGQVAALSRDVRRNEPTSSRLFPGAWQVAPTPLTVSGWIVLLLAVVAAAMWLALPRGDMTQPFDQDVERAGAD